MSKYEPRDQSAWRAARTTEIVSGRPLRPNGECHMCGWDIGNAGALYCCMACAQDYLAERARLKNPSGNPSNAG